MKYLLKNLAVPVLMTIITFTGSLLAKSNIKKVKLDYAYYNPLSLVLKEKGYLESELSKDGIKVEWVLSQGSNKALEYLNSKSVDFGSTAGVAALISRANGNPVKSIYVYSKPEWTALVTRADSKIKTVADLKGKKVAATRGTDPFVFLVRSLANNGLTIRDVEFVALQHADGKNALLRGDVDAWAGLDPLLGQAEVENNAILFYRDVSLNTYGVLNTREEVIAKNPEIITIVLNAYEKARSWAISNPEEFRALYVREAKIVEPVAAKVLGERTDITQSSIGDIHKKVIAAAGDVLKKNGVIDESVNIEKIVNELIEPKFSRDFK